MNKYLKAFLIILSGSVLSALIIFSALFAGYLTINEDGSILIERPIWTVIIIGFFMTQFLISKK